MSESKRDIAPESSGGEKPLLAVEQVEKTSLSEANSPDDKPLRAHSTAFRFPSVAANPA